MRICSAEKVEAIAVCLLHSFANPAHELHVGRRRRAHGAAHAAVDFLQVLPEINEYERTSTTVINAYVMPIVATYLHALRRQLDAAEFRAPLLIMQSNGGLMTDAAARERPMHIIESGPAGGVVGAQALARSMAVAKIITFDMGGTTAKASIVEDGQLMRAQEYAVGAGIMIGSRLLTGAGYSLKVPAIDLAEVGAGGGSHVWIDAGGSLQVGPESAGASPGPVCYGQGGDVPTITDANVILGFINPKHLIGGALPLDAERAQRVFEARIAKPLGLGLAAAAFGAHEIAASNMIRAIKAVSTERGRDPRQCRPVCLWRQWAAVCLRHGPRARHREVIVPPAPGLFSAFGLLWAEVEHHYSRTFRRRLRGADRRNRGRLERARRPGAGATESEGFAGAGARLRARRRCTTTGRASGSPCRSPSGPGCQDGRRIWEDAFGREHERTYGHRAGAEEPVELVWIQVWLRVCAQPTAAPSQGIVEPSRAPPEPAAPGLFRISPRLARHPDPAAVGPGTRPSRPANPRGVRCHLRRAPRGNGEA